MTLNPIWKPRFYQVPFLSAMQKGCKRAVLVWHRRAGKDATVLNWTVRAAWERPGVYWHMFPEARQGRKAIWDGLDGEGRAYREYWGGMAVSGNSQEMSLRLSNGGVWQVVGSDNYDSLVGANPVGVVFSEYSIADPRAWDKIRPILAENGGWAVFVFTPRGRNHGYKLWDMACRTEGWFAQKLGVEDTGAIDRVVLEGEKAQMMLEEYEQEYECSWNAPMVGSYYGQIVESMEKEGRVGVYGLDVRVPVHTSWDLGVNDATAVLCWQNVGGVWRMVHGRERRGLGAIKMMKGLQEWGERNGVMWGLHLWPHDGGYRDMLTGVGRDEMVYEETGVRVEVCDKDESVEAAIEDGQRLLPRLCIDRDGGEEFLKALVHYHGDFDNKRLEFKKRPVHDWSSHYADAYRLFARNYRLLKDDWGGKLPKGDYKWVV